MIGICTDANNEPIIQDGTLYIGDNTASIAQLLVVSNRGDFKEYPLIGGEAQQQQGASHINLWLTRVKKQLNAIGIDAKVVYDNGQINITF